MWLCREAPTSEMEKEGLREEGVALFCLSWLVDINSNLSLTTLTNLSKPTSEGKVYHCLLPFFKEKKIFKVDKFLKNVILHFTLENLNGGYKGTCGHMIHVMK